MAGAVPSPGGAAAGGERLIRIGGASGAWGDSPRAVPQLLGEPVDYLMMDYLAEVSMSLLARARMKAPESGFPPDFIAYLKDHLAEIKRRGIRVVTNAGGVNPRGCQAALLAVCRELSLDLKIAAVTGDDVLPLIEALRAEDTREAVSGAPLPARLLTANAYLGALPIRAALDAGADVVVTGRCADSALALGILMHEFHWHPDDFDRLAAGSLAGHLLECGAQGVGGLHTDWERVPDWANIGYPIAECRADGSFVVTKPRGTGGLVVPDSVAEQALYEIGDPSAYVLPDVVADFSAVRLEQDGEHRVRVTGARGRAPTTRYKVSATHQDGYRAMATVSIVGPDAAAKAGRTAEALIERARLEFRARGLPDFTATHVEALGAEASYGEGSRLRASREVLLRVVVTHADAKCIDIFARELGSVGISFAPGTTGIYNGRPKPAPLIRLYTFYLDKTRLAPPQVWLTGSAAGAVMAGGVADADADASGDADGAEREPIAVEIPAGTPAAGATAPGAAAGGAAGNAEAGAAGAMRDVADAARDAAEPVEEVPLIRVALARSGDKGDSSNIAIIARDPAFVPVLRRELTAERVAAHFKHLVTGPVQRFEAPGLHAFNFLLEGALGGGGMASLRIDPQGKAYAPMALEIMIRVPRRLLARA